MRHIPYKFLGAAMLIVAFSASGQPAGTEQTAEAEQTAETERATEAEAGQITGTGRATEAEAGQITETGRATEAEAGQITGTEQVAEAEQPQEPNPAELRREARLFDSHTVSAGETLYSIARTYGISIVTVVEDNPDIDPTLISPGQTILIRKREQGKTGRSQMEGEWEELRDTATELSEDYVFHIVKPGETLYSLGRMYGVPPDTLSAVNFPEGGTLKAGMMIRIPTGNAVKYLPAGENLSDTNPMDGTLAGEPYYEGEGSGIEEWGSGHEEWNSERDGFDGRDRGGFRSDGRIPEIALMLPLEGVGAAGNDFIDFYRGSLLALQDLKSEDRSLTVTLWDTARSPEKVREIVTSSEFYDTDLLIGPVYENEMEYAVRWGERYGVPVISPLATIRELDSDVLYQMAPDPASKYDKLAPLFEGGANIILVSSGTSDDAEFESEIEARFGGSGNSGGNFGGVQNPGGSSTSGSGSSSISGLGNGITSGNGGAPANFGRFTIGRGDITSLIDWNRENVFVVLAGTELAVDRALASISSAYNNASARRGRRADIKIVGSSKWANYNAAVDKNLFFKLNVRFVTSYYIDNTNPVVTRFERRYLTSYGEFPSRSAFRGYDAIALFGGSLLEFWSSETLGEVNTTPIGTPYSFVHTGGYRRSVNDQWTLVEFSDDFNVTVE